MTRAGSKKCTYVIDEPNLIPLWKESLRAHMQEAFGSDDELRPSGKLAHSPHLLDLLVQAQIVHRVVPRLQAHQSLGGDISLNRSARRGLDWQARSRGHIPAKSLQPSPESTPYVLSRSTSSRSAAQDTVHLTVASSGLKLRQRIIANTAIRVTLHNIHVAYSPVEKTDRVVNCCSDCRTPKCQSDFLACLAPVVNFLFFIARDLTCRVSSCRIDDVHVDDYNIYYVTTP